MLQRIANIGILHVGRKLRQRSGWRKLSPGQSLRDRVAMLGDKLQTVQFTQDFDPPGGPLHVRLAVDIFERAEGKIGLWACQLVERTARGFREHPDRVTSIKREDLSAWIAEPLGGNQTQRSGLARSGWPDNQSVAE